MIAASILWVFAIASALVWLDDDLPPSFSVARVLARGDIGTWQGSAMPIDCIALSDGSYRVTFLTARHVVEGAGRMWVNIFEPPNFQFQRQLVPVHLIEQHPTLDAALFTARLTEPLLTLRLDYRVPELGEHVRAAGYSQGRMLTIGDGVVSSLVFYWLYPEWQGAYICSALSADGMSGGALLDSGGDILGILVGGYDDSEHSNIFLPVIEARDWIESVRYDWEPK